MEITIRSLQSTSLDDIYAAWQAAFAGYEKSWTREELEANFILRGYNAALSFVAFEGGQLLGLYATASAIFEDCAPPTTPARAPSRRVEGAA